MKAKLSLIALAALAGCATAAPDGPAAGETSIPYVASNGIAEWQAEGDEALYIKDVMGQWYHVRTMGTCSRLRTAISLGFVTSALDHLDRHGAIIAEGQRCPLASVTRSGGPPAKQDS